MSQRILTCPFCGNTVKYGYHVCRGCGAELDYGPGIFGGVFWLLKLYIVSIIFVVVLANIYPPSEVEGIWGLIYDRGIVLAALVLPFAWVVGTKVSRRRSPMFKRRFRH